MDQRFKVWVQECTRIVIFEHAELAFDLCAHARVKKSSVAPPLVTTIGIPHSAASNGVRLKPSARYGDTRQSLALYRPWIWCNVRLSEMMNISDRHSSVSRFANLVYFTMFNTFSAVAPYRLLWSFRISLMLSNFWRSNAKAIIKTSTPWFGDIAPTDNSAKSISFRPILRRKWARFSGLAICRFSGFITC